jgi:hypothetical protein
MSNILVTLAAEFTGKKAFKQAENATESLTRNVKNLGKAFGVAFSTAAVVQFGKQSVRAFMDAEREGTVLANTVKNLGLAFDQPAIDAYIDKIGRLYGITGGQAVPAMQALLSATGSASKAQDIFNTAIDTSSALTLDVTDVAKALSQAYLGNTKVLSKYNTGLTKAELAASDFDKIQTKLNKNFNGAGKEAAKTYSGQLLILTEAGNQAKEVLGQGIIDSLMILSGDTTVEELADTMLTAAENAAQLSANLSKVIKTINTPLDLASKGLAWFVENTSPLVNLIVEGDPSGFMKKKGKTFPSTPSTNSLGAGTVLKTAEQIKQDQLRAKAEKDAIARAKALAKLIKDQAAAQAKILKDKRLAAAIDKANLALGKATDVFDIDKIQLNAAMINQAELLGKATSQSQALMITNDIARLKVKQDIAALEDAIAAKDEKAIIAATAKLNEDLKILGALTNQELKMLDIEKILKTLLPADLINLQNLKDAIDLLQKIVVPSMAPTNTLTGAATATAVKKLLTSAEVNDLLATGSFVPVVAGAGGSLGGASNAGNYASSGFPGADTNNGTTVLNVVNNFGIVGDPNSAAEVITDIVRNAVDRGTLRAS